MSSDAVLIQQLLQLVQHQAQRIEQLAHQNEHLAQRITQQAQRIEQQNERITQQAQRIEQQNERITQQAQATSLLLQDYARSLANVIQRQSELPSKANLRELQDSLRAFETLFSEHMSNWCNWSNG